MPAATTVAFVAADGYPLAGTLHRSAAGSSPAACVVINAGAGIPATYYDRFAAWLAEEGVPVLSYDYRGIGSSRPASLRGFKTSVEEWGSKDCAAAIATLSVTYPGVPLLLLGHSVGCFAAGFLHDPATIAGMVFVAPHTGYYGDYASRQRPMMWMAWHAMMPLLTRAIGYFPGRRLGLPEDLPRGVALEWAARRRPDFRWNLRLPDGSPDAARHAALQQRFAAFRGSALSVRVSDDAFSTAAGEARIEGLFSGVRFEHAVFEPAACGTPAIGHFGYFRSRAREALWPRIRDWIAGRAWMDPVN